MQRELFRNRSNIYNHAPYSNAIPDWNEWKAMSTSGVIPARGKLRVYVFYVYGNNKYNKPIDVIYDAPCLSP